METSIPVKNQTYAGVFFVALATLTYEILLTRIFSVTMWYHFAFMAISVAMFGMAVGAIIVYLSPRYFTPERSRYFLALSALLFAISIVVSFLTHISIPVHVDTNLFSVVGIYSLVLTYIVISVPFVFSGICLCLALTKFPRKVSKIYAADLVGAALGCVLLIYILNLTDGPSTVFITAFLTSVGAVIFSIGENHTKLKRITFISSFLLLLLALGSALLANNQTPLVRLLWVKGEFETRPLYEKWNSFSRIRITGNPMRLERPFGWGISSAYKSEKGISQLDLNIDASALTTLTSFDGDLEDLEFLKYDVVNFAHYIRPNSDVMVIGAGGGRDILSALVFDQKSVIGIEMNEDLIEAVNGRYGDYTGHLDNLENVTFVNDEARSYITRNQQKYDIIQSSLVDTWAATSAGAYLLSENSLYTVEAWRIFLEHLNDDGVLTFSRWYSELNGAAYRVTSLACAALRQMGVENPRDHIVIVKYSSIRDRGLDNRGIGNFIVCKEPFTREDLYTIEEMADKLQFEILLSPEYSADAVFETITAGANLQKFYSDFPLNISPSTDDNPFFFYTVRARSLLNLDTWRSETVDYGINMAKPVIILFALFIITIALSLLCIIFPLLLTTRRASLKGAAPFLVFFSAIGFGFMLIEISQMQRLILFLGHPTYSLSVVLFALLLSSGLGSFTTQRIKIPGGEHAILFRLGLLLIILIILGELTLPLTEMFQASVTIVRILVAIGILFPLGLFMGMAFPLGIKAASAKSSSLTPWFWGVNGATSVCASVLAIMIALGSGISLTYWTGFSCYIIALFSVIWLIRRTKFATESA